MQNSSWSQSNARAQVAVLDLVKTTGMRAEGFYD
jgi:hypothetical protein